MYISYMVRPKMKLHIALMVACNVCLLRGFAEMILLMSTRLERCIVKYVSGIRVKSFHFWISWLCVWFSISARGFMIYVVFVSSWCFEKFLELFSRFGWMERIEFSRFGLMECREFSVF